MENRLDKQYTDLLQDIIDNGVGKGDRTGTGTVSVFGRQIRHDMSDGFPLLTTKKMPWKVIVTELTWFLKGDTNIQFLVKNGCNIWNGDAYKKYTTIFKSIKDWEDGDEPISMKDFIEKIKTDDEFAHKWGELGPIYGAQWRNWGGTKVREDNSFNSIEDINGIDQIARLIHDLKNNPDSRRLMVNAWNVGEIKNMTLPPCHYGFQCWTRELSYSERLKILETKYDELGKSRLGLNHDRIEQQIDDEMIPKREISLMWNQRSVDTFLGLPFNIASYGLLLEILAKEVNMVPGELIGNLGDTHLYSNHIEQAKEQIGNKIDDDERYEMFRELNPDKVGDLHDLKVRKHQLVSEQKYEEAAKVRAEEMKLFNTMIQPPYRTREPFPLTKIKFIEHLGEFVLDDYKSHPTIKAPLSN